LKKIIPEYGQDPLKALDEIFEEQKPD